MNEDITTRSQMLLCLGERLGRRTMKPGAELDYQFFLHGQSECNFLLAVVGLILSPQLLSVFLLGTLTDMLLFCIEQGPHNEIILVTIQFKVWEQQEIICRCGLWLLVNCDDSISFTLLSRCFGLIYENLKHLLLAYLGKYPWKVTSLINNFQIADRQFDVNNNESERRNSAKELHDESFYINPENIFQSLPFVFWTNSNLGALWK